MNSDQIQDAVEGICKLRGINVSGYKITQADKRKAKARKQIERMRDDNDMYNLKGVLLAEPPIYAPSNSKRPDEWAIFSLKGGKE